MPRDGSGVWTPPAGTTATAGTPIESAKYNAFIADLTADANAARPIVAGGTGATTAGAALAALGGQPLDAGLSSIAGLTTAADRMIYATAADTYAVATLTAAGRAILADADAAAQRATLGAQAADATLTSLSGLTLAAGDILYATGADTLVKLAKGTAEQVLQMNSGATAPEWGALKVKGEALDLMLPLLTPPTTAWASWTGLDRVSWIEIFLATNSGTTNNIEMRLSSDGGATWAAASAVTTGTGAAFQVIQVNIKTGEVRAFRSTTFSSTTLSFTGSPDALGIRVTNTSMFATAKIIGGVSP